MVKMREANYCNLKLLLIFLVVYGHWIELSIHDSEILMLQYRMRAVFPVRGGGNGGRRTVPGNSNAWRPPI